MPSKHQKQFHPRHRKSNTLKRRLNGEIPADDKPNPEKRLVRAKRLLSLFLEGTIPLSPYQLKELEFSGVRTPAQQKQAWNKIKNHSGDSPELKRELKVRAWEAKNGIASYQPLPEEAQKAG